MAINVGLLSTISTNIGDDFIREGIVSVINDVLKNEKVDLVIINKHEPREIYPSWHPIRSLYRRGFVARKALAPLRKVAERWLPLFGFSKFDKCDIVIQCGTPIIWEGCRNSEWARLIWRDVLARLSRRGTPILNIGGGSAYPWERQPATLAGNADESFIRLMLVTSRLTIVRDELARRLFETLGFATRKVCCPAILAGQSVVAPAKATKKVLINYMEGGGHYDFGQGIDSSVWEKTMRDVVKELRQRGWQLVFLAHNEKESELAARIWPDLPCVFPNSQRDYFEVVRDAAFGIFNRMHASVAAAGLGIPSVAIGTDTRNLMVETTGLSVLYVKEATADRLLFAVDNLAESRDSETQRLLKLRQETFETYKSILRPFLLSAGSSN